ncbi:hypothetical protein AC578_7250 [Pseudocercospora eumusae]|uniref:Uncharacterized protein n=1 Tax=Pseudocercospora eumusae TaxID=321146 RepID=A0A139HWG8_9PEZI|nr:hypothetical protein AC578_7250 [Pseudocercospora eumusae]
MTAYAQHNLRRQSSWSTTYSNALSHSQSRDTVDLKDISLGQTELHGDTNPLLRQTTSNIKGWPTAPKAVNTTALSFLSESLIDVALLVFSVLFLGFALAVISFDQKETAEWPRVKTLLYRASRVGPSVFPILFACVIGRVAHTTLLWRLEKGERLGVLDLLAGSTSLTSTVTSQLRSRVISILGIVLVAVWALSPVGGQASIRQLSFGNDTSTSNATFTYMTPTSNALGYYGNQSSYPMLHVPNTLFLASLIASPDMKHSALDLWGNFKVPFLESFENVGRPDQNGWYNTSGPDTEYASLVGVPITSNTSLSGRDHVFKAETSYLHVECPSINVTSSEPTSALNGSTFKGAGTTLSLNFNANCGGVSDFTNGSIAGFDTSCTPPKFDGAEPPCNVTYYDWYSKAASFCEITTTYVEVEVFCPSDSSCAAQSIRRSRLPHPPATQTVLNAHMEGENGPTNFNWGLFSAAFVTSSTGNSGFPTAVQCYLIDPDSPLDVLAALLSKRTPAGLPVPRTSYEIRMGQLINAYWTSLTAFQAISQAKATGKTDLTFNMTQALLDGNTHDLFLGNSSTVNGQEITHFEVFVCHRGWAITLCAASLLLIAACLIQPMIRCFFNKAPDLLLNVSSLATRDNPHIAVPGGGTALNGSERAKLLQKLKVRLGDAEPGNDVGHLVIASVDDSESGTGSETSLGRVRRGRLYK